MTTTGVNAMFACPVCGLMGRIDSDQVTGVTSIICPEDEGGCGWHGYIGEAQQ